jgi:hypothetical protein
MGVYVLKGQQKEGPGGKISASSAPVATGKLNLK